MSEYWNTYERTKKYSENRKHPASHPILKLTQSENNSMFDLKADGNCLLAKLIELKTHIHVCVCTCICVYIHIYM